ncbi:ArnT family glycosyltransferase [Microvirga antarctica]|uniref:ArnT family glycosyltransferase n=1 Tax=Microvirga antarctica TaxID=2819233 RepID=UPI001B31319A
MIFLALFLPTIARHADDALMLATFIDDDALITMQLDGMTAWPYGNPAQYLGPGGAPGVIPAHWYNINYQELPYYGGLYPDLAFLIWMPLKLAGLPLFPTGPIILRLLAIGFSVCTLLAAYNFARRSFGRTAAMVSLLFLATESQLIFIGTVIHPDSLLFFLMIVSLGVCLRHAADGGTGSLVAIGIAAGLAQGAKMGGPLLVPVTVLAICLGSWRHVQERTAISLIACISRRGAAVFVIALAVFALTTPYAFVDSYFFRVWRAWASTFTSESPISVTTFWDWLSTLRTRLGTGLIAAALLGACLFILRERNRLPLIFAALLGLTIFLYYALFQKFWVQPQYLVICYWVVALSAAYCVQFVVSIVPAFGQGRYQGVVAGGVVLAISLFSLSRLETALVYPIRYAFWREAPNYIVGSWASANLKAVGNPKILIDGPAYFDPSQIRDVYLRGGPVRYEDLLKFLPDYFLLTRYVDNWQAKKIAGPKPGHWDPDLFNIRLYQDLLGGDKDAIDVDTRSTPFASHVASFGWMKVGSGEGAVWDPDGTYLPATVRRVLDEVPLVTRAAYRAWRDVKFDRHVSLFKLDREVFMQSVPVAMQISSARPLASSSAPDAPPDSIILGNDNWRSAKQGLEAVGEYVGFELPFAPAAPKTIVVRWVAWHWCPESIEIEASDDGSAWKSLGIFPVKEPADVASRNQGTNRWEETFTLPVTTPHRFWRIKAHAMKDANYFGLERIRIQ